MATAAAGAADEPSNVIFSSADASDAPWGVREYIAAAGWAASPLFSDDAAATAAVDGVGGGTVVCKHTQKDRLPTTQKRSPPRGSNGGVWG